MTFFAAAHSSTPDDVVAHVDAEENRVHRDLHAHRELEVVAGDHGRRREPAHDLVGDVRPGEDSDRTVADESRQPCPGGGIEPLGQAENRRVARKLRYDVAEDTARNGDDDELGVRDWRVGNRSGGDAREVCRLRVPRVPAGRVDRLGLSRVARRERHLVAVVPQKTRDGGPPRPRSDHDDPHSDVTKSMETGTPSSPKRARSSFSTQ